MSRCRASGSSPSRTSTRWRSSSSGSAWQLERAGPGWFDESVLDETRESAVALHVVVPHRLECRRRHSAFSLAQHGEQLTADLPVGAGVALTGPADLRLRPSAAAPRTP